MTLAFVVGQVQYAYVSYFCTMKQMPVSTPAMPMTSTTAEEAVGMCNECQAVNPFQERLQLLDANCVKVITAEKSVVSNFTDSQRSIQHFLVVAVIGDQLSSIGYRPSVISYRLFTQVNSPPLDLPTLNSNLRI